MLQKEEIRRRREIKVYSYLFFLHHILPYMDLSSYTETTHYLKVYSSRETSAENDFEV